MACSGSTFSFSSVVFAAGNGSKTVTVTETDLSGNVTTRTATVTLDTTKSASINSPNWNGHINGLSFTFSGSCVSAGNTFATTSTVGTVRSTSCTGNVLAINVRLNGDGTGLTSGSITVTGTRAVNGSQTTSTTNFTYSFGCPPGFVGVPGKWSGDTDVAALGSNWAAVGHTDAGLDPTRDFCVMKYPAKAATSNNGGQSPWEEITDGNKAFTMANVWPQARAAGTPWVNITRAQAIDRCKVLNEAYGLCSGAGCYNSYSNTTQGFRLMSNTQWQVVARNAELTAANWSSGVVASGNIGRGHSDNLLDSNAALHSQTFSAGAQNHLSHSQWDDNVYFGTGNNSAQAYGSGWEQRRTQALSTGAKLWDVGGNIWQWVDVAYDHNSVTYMGPCGLCGFWPTNATGTAKLQVGPTSTYTANSNIFGFNMHDYPGGGLLRGGTYDGTSTNIGLFGAVGTLTTVGTQTAFYSAPYLGFRCTYVPPPLTGPLDTGVPAVTVQRTTSTGTALGSNPAITVASSGLWHVGFNVTDAENTGADANKLWIQVRRKIAVGQANSDYPILTDAVYREGYLPSFQLPNTYTGTAGFGLADETAWTLDPTTLKYTRNDGKFINYLVTVIDPTGNKSDATVGNGGTISIQNTQSCPQGYVGVPGLNGAATAWNDPAINAGLGNVNATAGNSNKGLDVSSAFCVMKFPAKIQSANTTVAASFVGGKLEPIANGNNTFSQVSTAYADAAAFDTNIRYIPDSRAPGTPWVNISRDNSILACRSLQMAYLSSMPDTTTGTGFQLISNTQWQMMARNAENQAANWSNNAVGSGVHSRGHSDGAISTTETTNSWCFGCTAPSTSLSAIPNSINDINVYFATGAASSFATWNTLGTAPAAGAEQRRTSALSNGGTLHDVAGNLWQFVGDDRLTMGIPTGDDTAGLNSGGFKSFLNGAVNRFSSTSNLLFGNFGTNGTQYSESSNFGQLFGGAGSALLRAGSFVDGSGVGLFSAVVGNTPSAVHIRYGFRCAFIP